jgi:hypothetical protein
MFSTVNYMLFTQSRGVEKGKKGETLALRFPFEIPNNSQCRPLRPKTRRKSRAPLTLVNRNQPPQFKDQNVRLHGRHAGVQRSRGWMRGNACCALECGSETRRRKRRIRRRKRRIRRRKRNIIFSFKMGA